MDGIPVKINEKYKPPPKITLPACILNRLNNVQFNHYSYDFSLETTVSEHLTKLNKICNDEIEQFESKNRKVSPPEQPDTTAGFSESSMGSSEPTILTPVPISSCSAVTTSRKEDVFKYSDFENDTSSPFDNEELKTLNDMEELAHVLGATSVSGHRHCLEERGVLERPWPQYGSPSQGQFYPGVCYNPMATSHGTLTYPPQLSQVPNYPTVFGQPSADYSRVGAQGTFVQARAEGSAKLTGVNGENEEDGRVSEIVKSLCEYLGQHKVSETANITRLPKTEEPPSFLKLNDQQQKMARRVGDMGFPLSRATAAVKHFGLDESKIIEYLLLVQSFIDKGYSESQTIRALEINQYDETQTENYLKVLSQIMKLGFKEEEVVTALAKTKNDRDKALDILIR